MPFLRIKTALLTAARRLVGAKISLNPLWRAVHDVETTAVGFPSWDDPFGEVFIRVGKPPIMFFLEFVLWRAWIGIAAIPECLNELIPSLVIGELFEVGTFLVSNDPDDVLIEPLALGAFLGAIRLLGTD